MSTFRIGALAVSRPAAVLIAAGLLIVAFGLGLIYLPLGVIVLGVELAAVGVAVDLSTPDEEAT